MEMQKESQAPTENQLWQKKDAYFKLKVKVLVWMLEASSRPRPSFPTGPDTFPWW